MRSEAFGTRTLPPALQRMMEVIAHAFVAPIGALILMVAPIWMAVLLMGRRRRHAREQRRSPLTVELLRPAGEALRQQIQQERLDATVDGVLLVWIPSLPLAFFHIQQAVTGRPTPTVAWLMALLLIIVVTVFLIRRLLRRGHRLDRLTLGLDAEMAVGQELEHLRADGALVFHDLPADQFNIDHVVIARQGVFAVETKGFSKPGDLNGKAGARIVYDGRTLKHPRWESSKPIEQVQRQSAWLADFLTKATGEPVHVTPVLVVPGWFVELAGRGDVAVLNGSQVRKHLLSNRSAHGIDDAQKQRIVHQVEQRCRNLTPTYRIDPDD